MRWGAAFLVSLVALSGCLQGAGYTFTAPALGAHATYETVFRSSEQAAWSDPPLLRTFDWEAPREFVGPDGGMWEAPTIAESFEIRFCFDADCVSGFFPRVHYVDDRGHMIATEVQLGDSSAGLVPGTTDDESEVYVLYDQHTALLPCGFTHDAAGTAVHAGDMVVFQACPARGPTRFQVVDAADGEARLRAETGDGWVNLTFRDAPVAAEMVIHTAIPDGWFETRLELTEHRPGTDPLPAITRGPAPDLPVPELTPWDLQGLVAPAGVTRFSLAEAIEELQALGTPELDALFAGEWWLQRALWARDDDRDGFQEDWRIYLAGSGGGYYGYVSSDWTGVDGPSGPVFIETDRSATLIAALPATVDASLLPERAPTMESVAARWMTRAGASAEELNLFGFDFACANIRCEGASDWFVAGHVKDWYDLDNDLDALLAGEPSINIASYYGEDRHGTPQGQIFMRQSAAVQT